MPRIVDFPNVLHSLWIALGIFGATHRTQCQEYLISLTGVCKLSINQLFKIAVMLNKKCSWGTCNSNSFIDILNEEIKKKIKSTSDDKQQQTPVKDIKYS